jgi:phosphonate transport system substrate-binding protein
MLKTHILLFALLLPFSSNLAADGSSFSFGVVPQQSASKLAQLWGPVLQQLTQDSGIKLRFATAPDIPTFEKRLAEGEYDFAYMNPYHYTVFQKTNGYRALARARDKQIKGVFVVRAESPIQRLVDLAGTTLAFPAPAAFAASIVTQTHLKVNDIPFQAKYVSSHDSVYRTVAKGIYPAGGGIMRTLNNVDSEIRKQLRVLWTSQGYTPHAIAAHPRVNDENLYRLQQALVNLDQRDEGATTLQKIKIKAFQVASDRDWDDIRNLRLHELENL